MRLLDSTPCPVSRAPTSSTSRSWRASRSTDEEIEHFTGQLEVILEHAAQIAALDTHDVPPTAHPLPIVNVFRADEVRPSLPRDEVLAMAPASEDGRFRVPRILDAP